MCFFFLVFFIRLHLSDVAVQASVKNLCKIYSICKSFLSYRSAMGMAFAYTNLKISEW